MDYGRFVGSVLRSEGPSGEMKREMLTPQVFVRDHDSWSLGFGVQQDANGDAIWQWGDYGTFRDDVIAYPERKAAVVYLTNSLHGLNICADLVSAAVGGELHGLGWLS